MIQVRVRSTLQRLGTAMKRCRSVRLTMSRARVPVLAAAAAALGP